jgi:hypothetical protein
MNIKALFISALIILGLSSGFSMNMTQGSYPGEIFTNCIMYVDGHNDMHYCFGYSPDFGKHFIVTMNSTEQSYANAIYGTGYFGEFYFHDAIDGYLFRFHNFGASFSYENLEMEGIDYILPGEGIDQLYLIENTADGCFLYASENGGTTYRPVNHFPQVKIRPMAREKESDTIYLLGYDNAEDIVRLFVSDDNGGSFASFVLDSQVLTPDVEELGFLLLPTPDGTLYLFHGTHLQNGQNEYRIYESEDNLQNCTLVWQYTPLIYEFLYLLWTGAEGSEFLLQRYFWHMAYNRLEYCISSDEVIDFQPVALYNFFNPYQNPVFLVPTPSRSVLAPEAGSLKLYVRSNADWQIGCDADWVSGFSQTTGSTSADVFMDYEANLTGMDRSCVVRFLSSAAPDTALTITQSGVVGADDPTGIAEAEIRISPNPFTFSTSIKGNVPLPGKVGARIYNVRGELVRVLSQASDARGGFSLDWDARDEAGKACGAGIYIYRLSCRDTCRTGKLVLIKQ